MKTHFFFLIIASIVLGLVFAYREYYPEPPADYEIYYFGSTQCSVCKTWKNQDYVSWKGDDAYRYAPIKMAEITPGISGNSGQNYFSYNEVFERAFGDRNSVAWPSFVLMDGDEIKVAASGLGAWHKIENRVRYESRRVHRLTEAGRLCQDPSQSPKCI